MTQEVASWLVDVSFLDGHARVWVDPTLEKLLLINAINNNNNNNKNDSKDDAEKWEEPVSGSSMLVENPAAVAAAAASAASAVAMDAKKICPDDVDEQVRLEYTPHARAL